MPEVQPSPLIAKLARHPWRVLVVALLLSLVAAWGTYLLPILTSRKALVPQDIPESKRLDRFLENFGSASDLILVVEGKGSREEREAFIRKLTLKLNKEPEVGLAVERVDIRFFLENAFLLIPPEALSKFSGVLDELIEREAENPPGNEDRWDQAMERMDAWLEEAPSFGDADMNIKTARESLALVTFLQNEWLRWLTAPSTPSEISWNELLARRGAEGMANGYYASRDGRMHFLFVRAAKPSEEIDTLGPFIERVRQVSDKLAAEWQAAGHAAIRVGQTSLPAAGYEEYHAIRSDISLILTTAAILVILLILLWLRSIRWALIVFLPMLVGALWNLGLAYLLVGHLTILTFGFTAILFGLGVDYGIFLSSRILEARGKCADWNEASAQGAANAAQALLTAGGATFLIFGALATVDFQGFRELGLVAATGVALVMLSTFALQPVMFRLLPPSHRVAERSTKAEDAPVGSGLKVPTPAAVLLLSVAVAAAAGGVWMGFQIPFDYDVMGLLPKNSEASRLSRRMQENSDFSGEVVIFTANSVKEAHAMAAKAEALPSISRVQKITDLFPGDSEQRASIGREVGQKIKRSAYVAHYMKLGPKVLNDQDVGRIRQVLEKGSELIEDAQEQALGAGHTELVRDMEGILTRFGQVQDLFDKQPEQARARSEAFMATAQDRLREGLKVLMGWTRAAPMTPDRLPDALRDRFFAKNGMVAFYAYPADSVYKPKFLDKLTTEVYSVSPEATGFPTTHHEFSNMVVRSFAQSTWRSGLVALLWIGFILRRPRSWLIASLPLLIGGGWMMGLMALFGQEFNYANIIGLPLVMGLAVDYGVWYAHRRDDLPDRSPWRVTRVAGRAILLAAGTTVAGLGAITLASYQGVSTMGTSITLGLVSCVVAALLVSPALAQLLFRSRS